MTDLDKKFTQQGCSESRELDFSKTLSLSQPAQKPAVKASSRTFGYGEGIESDHEVKTEIKQKYKVIKLLGEGGASRVYLCERNYIGDHVALKMLLPSLAKDPLVVKRFIQEGATTASIKHHNVITVHDFDFTEDQTPFIVTELLCGSTLSDELEEQSKVSMRRALQIMMPICSALKIAHSQGIVHRDLKPSNVVLHRMQDGTEVIKLIDFGIAKQTVKKPADNITTDPGITFGTPEYMSPEQCLGDPLDGRSDIYSLGVLFFKMVTGHLPFEDESIPRVMLHHLHTAPPSPREFCPEITEEVAKVICQALAKEPDDRFASITDFADALLFAITGRSDKRTVS